MATVATRIEFEEIKPKIGVRILNSKEELLSGELSQDVLDLLETRGVVVLPQINFTDAEQVAFSNLLGGNVEERGNQAVFKVSLDEAVNDKIAEYLKGSLSWHIDGTLNKVPVRASMLQAQVLSPEGGDTEFANTASAYEDLPEARKKELEGLRVVHSLWASSLYHTAEPTLKQLEDWQSHGEAELPLVVTHGSGRKSLVLGNTAHYIKGMDMKESALILHGLRDFATRDEYVYTHKWKLGDVVIWDNRTSLHRATPYDPASGRMMHRTIIRGGEAWEQ